MAEKRMISKVISISKKFNIRLDDHFSRLLYVLLIPHSDDFGRLTGDSFKIKALILPMMDDVKWEEVEETLGKLHAAELIVWYEVSGEKYIQIINFDDHQQGLHKRTRSKFPDPPGISRKFPEIPFEEKGTELNRTEQNGSDLNLPGHSSHSNLFLKQINTLNIKMRGAYELDEVTAYIGIMEAAIISEAIKRSEGKNGAYILSILKDWHSKGYSKLDDIKTKLERVEKPAQPNRLSLIPLYEVTEDDRRKEKERDDRLRSRNQSPTGTS